MSRGLKSPYGPECSPDRVSPTRHLWTTCRESHGRTQPPTKGRGQERVRDPVETTTGIIRLPVPVGTGVSRVTFTVVLRRCLLVVLRTRAGDSPVESLFYGYRFPVTRSLLWFVVGSVPTSPLNPHKTRSGTSRDDCRGTGTLGSQGSRRRTTRLRTSARAKEPSPWCV